MAWKKRLGGTKEERSLGQACGDGQKFSLPHVGWRLHDPATPLLDIYPRRMSAPGPTKTGTRMFIDALLRIIKKLETTQMSISGRKDKHFGTSL